MEINQNFEEKTDTPTVTENNSLKNNENNEQEVPRVLKISSGFIIIALILYLIPLGFAILLAGIGWGPSVFPLEIFIIFAFLSSVIWGLFAKNVKTLIVLNVIFYGFTIFLGLNYWVFGGNW